MSKYNYAALSPQDFEEIIRDLLQAEWNVLLEAFRAGRDAGIDLRYAATPERSVIVQCKHYLASGFDKLLAHLGAIELPKVQRLAPARYVLATTVGLTPANKDKIVETLAPFVRSTADVLGADDIDGLLSRHADIERANFKLWLTSTSVLQRILHNAEIAHTDFEVERVRRKLPLFVQNEAYPRARQMLSETKVLVISGTPGIGKTTLAEMLLYSHLEEGYEPVVIQGEISEGRRMFRASERQIFYYDDFLGQTYFGDRKEYLGRNEDKAIVDFMEMVRTANDSRFVLTTREHILSGAVRLSARLGENPVLRDRIVLTLENYTFGERARMLYNHLYFSDLPQAHRDALLVDDFFLSVIRHPHFNPRLIEWLSTYSRLGAVLPADFAQHVSDLLDNPERIWDHAFNQQISEAARDVILTVCSAGSMGDATEIEPLFDALHTQKALKYNFKIASADFRNALREVDGAFLRYSNGYILFLNPSVREFVAALVCGDLHTCRDLWASVLRFKQLIALWRLVREKPDSKLATHLRDADTAFFERMLALADAPDVLWGKGKDGATTLRVIDCRVEVRLGFMAEYCDAEHNVAATKRVCAKMATMIGEWSSASFNWWSAPAFVEELSSREWFMQNGGNAIHEMAMEKLLDALPYASATNWSGVFDLRENDVHWREAYNDRLKGAFSQFTGGGLNEQLAECTSLEDKKSAIEALEVLGRKAKVSFSQVIAKLDQEVSTLEAEEEEPEVGQGAPRSTPEALRGKSMSDDEVRQMFLTLASH
jgi:hypothetical protein